MRVFSHQRLRVFSHQRLVSHLSLSDSKSLQVSRTLLSILANRNNAVLWMVSTRPLISKSSSRCTNPLVTVPRTPTTTGITVTLMFHNFFSFLARSRYSSFFSLSFNFPMWSAGWANSETRQVLSLFLLTITWSGRLVEIKWSVYISKSLRILCVSSSRTNSMCIYHLFVWSNFNFWHILLLLLLLLLLFTPLEFFTSALADCLSLEFKWQQVSSSLQDSFKTN